MSKALENELKESIDNTLTIISNKYPEIDIEKIWKSVSIKISKKLKTNKEEVKDLDTDDTKSVSSNSSKSSKSSSKSSCIYKYIKGIQKDEICNAKTKDGNQYCSKHKKYEGTNTLKEDKKSLPPVKETKQTIKPAIKKNNSREDIKPVQRLFRAHKKTGKLWHPETGLVIKSSKDRVVIGKIVEDKLIDLVEDDIDLCKKWRFAIEIKDEIKEKDDEKKDEIKDEEKDKKSIKKSIKKVLQVSDNSNSSESSSDDNNSEENSDDE